MTTSKHPFVFLLALFLAINLQLTQGQADLIRPYSAAGFFDLGGSGRTVYNFNVGWRYFKGDIEGAEKSDFNDKTWPVVSLPHTVELMPVEASGGRNYQGPVWYRKHVTLPEAVAGKRLTIHVEAAMGRTEVFVNGRFVLEHMGGYLPFIIDLSKQGIEAGDDCLIALKVDNSDDKRFPPGKPQSKLDFTYHGGVYRDVWLIATGQTHISDPNEANRVAGGGLFVHMDALTDKEAMVSVKTDVQNDGTTAQTLRVITTLKNPAGKVVESQTTTLSLKPGKHGVTTQRFKVTTPQLWSPENPSLYRVETRLTTKDGFALDGGITRIGLRQIEFKGKDGFYLNGKPYDKLIGGNRHQDFAYLGNAMPNPLHWRDAKLLREAGCRVIRVAHYPQDPSFMDACDELGLFVIVAIPGWQYFNKDPFFSERSYDDLRQTIRRDRNHPCLLMWEPILNETQFPAEYAHKTLAITREEYPYKDTYSAADVRSAGIKEAYDVMYGFPEEVKNSDKPFFTREWGEYVDDWYAHNSPNRVSRSWGEGPQIVQALHLAMVYDEQCSTPRQHIGGALWHPFDHQRGYHPDTYWGGLLDAFRQPKYAYYLFQSQTNPRLKHPTARIQPMLYVAHELTPFSNPDIVVFTNCDSVRLTRYEIDQFTVVAEKKAVGIPHAPLVFKNVFDNYAMRRYSYVQKQWQKASFLFEGYLDGEVVCRVEKMPSRRSTKLRLRVDHQHLALVADGSDVAVVICEVTDDEGNVRRLAKDNVLFTVKGEGEIIGDATNGANPRAVEFGSAPMLLRSTTKPGWVTVIARVQYEGEHTPLPDTLTLQTYSPLRPLLYKEQPWKGSVQQHSDNVFNQRMTPEERQRALEEVERQQTQFGEFF